MADEIVKALKSLLDYLRPELQRVQPYAWKLERQEQGRFAAVDVSERNDGNNPLAIFHALHRAESRPAPEFVALCNALRRDAVLGNAFKIAGYYGGVERITTSLVHAAVIRATTTPELSLERALKRLAEYREIFGAREGSYIVSARLLGVELTTPRIELGDVSLVRLSDDEINERQPVINLVYPLHQSWGDISEHRTELQATIKVPFTDDEEPLICGGTKAQHQAWQIGSDVIAALRLNWPGDIATTGVSVYHPLIGTNTSHVESIRSGLQPDSMKLGVQAEKELRKTYNRIIAAREDRVLNTSLHRFLLGRRRDGRLDRLIDYVIAWESILLTISGNAKNTESTYHFSINGASLLHAAGVESDRHKGRRLMNNLYAIRSKVVHGGTGESIAEKIEDSGYGDAYKLTDSIEQQYRAVFAWLTGIPKQDRPYLAAGGWETMLWGKPPTVTEAEA